MTKKMFTEFYATLLILPPQYGAPSDSDDLRRYYEFGLKKIPDDLGRAVMDAIINDCSKRPTVAEINRIKADITRSRTQGAVLDALSEVSALRRTLGARCVQQGWLFAVHDGKDLGRTPNMVDGTPAFMDPLTGRVIEAMDGWPSFCRSEAPVTVWQGQFRALYQAAAAEEDDETISRLRLSYRQALAALPPPALTAHDAEESRGAPEEVFTKAEAGALMARLGAVARAVPPSGDTSPYRGGVRRYEGYAPPTEARTDFYDGIAEVEVVSREG